MSKKFGTFVVWFIILIPNKSTRICLNIFCPPFLGDVVVLSLKRGKIGLVPIVRQKKLVDLFIMFSGQLIVKTGHAC